MSVARQDTIIYFVLFYGTMVPASLLLAG